MSTIDADAPDATPRALLPVPEPERMLALPLGAYLAEAARLAKSRLSFSLAEDLDEALREEAKCSAYQDLLVKLGQSEETARRAGLLACVFAREIGARLGEPRRGRPPAGEEVPLPELTDRRARERYRLAAFVGPDEFARWAEETLHPTPHGLATLGRRLRSESRDDEPEPPEPPDPPAPAGLFEDEDDDDAENYAGEGAARQASGPGPDDRRELHRWRAWKQHVSRLADDLEAWVEAGRSYAAGLEDPDQLEEIEETAGQAEAFLEDLRPLLEPAGA